MDNKVMYQIPNQIIRTKVSIQVAKLQKVKYIGKLASQIDW